jgi:hypothetical protein
LPNIDNVIPAYYEAKSSGSRTQAQEPPPVLIQEEDHRWTPNYIRAVDKVIEIKPELITLASINPYTPLGLRTEADVVTAYNLYITHPVMEVLCTLYPNKFTVSSECTESSSNPTTRVRLDMVFKTGSAQPKTIAIIEFKRRGQIRRVDWEPAILPSIKATPSAIAELKRKTSLVRVPADMRTLLKANATWFVKQVTAYAMQTTCPHVALFDWDHMVLFQFKDCDPASGQPGDKVNMVWVNEKMTNTEELSETKIRMALLGWLIEAFKSKGLTFCAVSELAPSDSMFETS